MTLCRYGCSLEDHDASLVCMRDCGRCPDRDRCELMPEPKQTSLLETK